jgi:hypothetical protein
MSSYPNVINADEATSMSEGCSSLVFATFGAQEIRYILMPFVNSPVDSSPAILAPGVYVGAVSEKELCDILSTGSRRLV